MRQILLYIAASLDGKIARKDHSIDWLPQPDNGTEDHGYKEMLDTVDVVLMGYKTYQLCVGFGEWPYKDKITYVFSRSKDKECISEVTLTDEDPAAFARQLVQQDGKNIWLVGGGEIIKQLHDAGLIDKYMIATLPVILGEGIELFPCITGEQKLKIDYNKHYEGSLVMTHYSKTHK